MKIGIITVRSIDYHPNGRLSEAAAERGHKAVLIHPYRVWPRVDANGLGSEGQPNLNSLDVVLPRQGATIGESSLTLIHHLSRMGVPLVNGYEAVCITRSQIMTLQVLAGKKIRVPDTVFVNNREGFLKSVPLVGGYPVVAKQASGRQGKGVYRVENNQQAETLLEEDFEPRTGLLLQRYIPTTGRQDIRVVVVGGKALGAMEMRPRDGDFRANFHLTQNSRSKKLTPAIANIALRATRAVGLDIAGVDLIVDRNNDAHVIEVNYSPGFNGLEKATGLDVAGRIIDYAVTRSIP